MTTLLQQRKEHAPGQAVLRVSRDDWSPPVDQPVEIAISGLAGTVEQYLDPRAAGSRWSASACWFAVNRSPTTDGGIELGLDATVLGELRPGQTYVLRIRDGDRDIEERFRGIGLRLATQLPAGWQPDGRVAAPVATAVAPALPAAPTTAPTEAVVPEAVAPEAVAPEPATPETTPSTNPTAAAPEPTTRGDEAAPAPIPVISPPPGLAGTGPMTGARTEALPLMSEPGETPRGPIVGEPPTQRLLPPAPRQRPAWVGTAIVAVPVLLVAGILAWQGLSDSSSDKPEVAQADKGQAAPAGTPKAPEAPVTSPAPAAAAPGPASPPATPATPAIPTSPAGHQPPPSLADVRKIVASKPGLDALRDLRDRLKQPGASLDASYLVHRELAQGGDAESMTAIGLMYDRDTWSAQTSVMPAPNPREAARWYRMGAEKGYAEAQYRYGRLLRQGGDEENGPEKSIPWLQAAAAQGHEGARKELGQ